MALICKREPTDVFVSPSKRTRTTSGQCCASLRTRAYSRPDDRCSTAAGPTAGAASSAAHQPRQVATRASLDQKQVRDGVRDCGAWDRQASSDVQHGGGAAWRRAAPRKHRAPSAIMTPHLPVLPRGRATPSTSSAGSAAQAAPCRCCCAETDMAQRRRRAAERECVAGVDTQGEAGLATGVAADKGLMSGAAGGTHVLPTIACATVSLLGKSWLAAGCHTVLHDLHACAMLLQETSVD